MIAVGIKAQKTASTNDLNPECLGNIIRLIVDPLLGRFEVDVIPGYSCGMSVKLDPMGAGMMFASVLSCFAPKMDDKTFSLAGQLRLRGNHMSEDSVYRVGKTCSYTPWASREILCDRTYMEASEQGMPQEELFQHSKPRLSSLWEGLRRGVAISGEELRSFNSCFHFLKQALASGYNMTAVVFSPSEMVMTVDELRRKGYAIANTPTRLVLRSPLKQRRRTYRIALLNTALVWLPPEQVAGVSMRLLSTSTFFQQKWLVTRLDATAACPTPGAVAFTPEMITWYMPRHLDPLISSGAFTMLEVYMGIDAKRLDAEEMAARKYSLSVTDAHIIIEIPVGAVGGYFKSHIQDDQYFVTYAIEPMLELLWIEEENEDTRYKVLFPITTPLMARPSQVCNYTPLDTEQPVFMFELGTFNIDVELLNVTFPTGVLTVAECNARGFNVQEHRSLDNTSKTFTMEVTFSDPVVFQEKRPEQGVAAFTLQLIYGLVVLPEYTPFSHPAVVDAVLQDVVPPSVTGNCDQDNFYITLNYGNHNPFFVVVVGKRRLTKELAQQYLTEGDTNFTITVPFSSPDAVFESVHSSFVRSRLDVAMLNPYNNITIKDFTLACSFLKTLTESAPSLNPGQLSLSDPACGPTYSDDRFAYFHFTVNSCGTTRKFINNVMLLTVSCYYMVNITHTLAFLTRPRNNEPSAETGTGQLMKPEAPYRVVFHPVVADARVHFPSHIKRFEVQMFSFAKDLDYLSGQLFVHCVEVICDTNSPSDLCSGQCENQDNNEKGMVVLTGIKKGNLHILRERRGLVSSLRQQHVSQVSHYTSQCCSRLDSVGILPVRCTEEGVVLRD
ncbi:unnamed protein product, partial [Coregonus sp. 'balchen']